MAGAAVLDNDIINIIYRPGKGFVPAEDIYQHVYANSRESQPPMQLWLYQHLHSFVEERDYLLAHKQTDLPDDAEQVTGYLFSLETAQAILKADLGEDSPMRDYLGRMDDLFKVDQKKKHGCTHCRCQQQDERKHNAELKNNPE